MRLSPVEAFLAHCRNECGLSANTLDAYTRDLRAFEATTLAGRHPLGIRPREIEQHVAELTKRGCSAATINRHLATIRRFLAFAGNEAAKSIDPPKQGDYLPKPLPQDVVVAMIEATTCAREKAVLEILYACGLRASELVTLRREDVHGDALLIRGKGAKQRMVPIHALAMKSLTDHLARTLTQSPMVFEGLTRFNVYDIVQRAGRRVGVDAHPHQLRHSYATHMLDGGAPINAISAMLGHDKIQTTARYTKVSIGHLKKCVREHHPRP